MLHKMPLNLFIFICLFSGVSSAVAGPNHETHNWSTDHKAFASAKIDSRRFLNNLNVFEKSQSFEILASDFKLKLEELTGVRDIKINGATARINERGSDKGRKLARQWLAQEYQVLGFVVTEHNYGKGANFIAEKIGNSGKVLILSSHMDSVSNAGANDDGTGTIANLLIAKAIVGVPLKHTLRIIAFDNEEQGLVGSNAYVKTLSDKSQIIGDIQMEMMAYNSKKDGKFHVIDCNRKDSTFMTDAIMNAIQSSALPLVRVKACTERSDHGAFWEANIPAIVISENFFGGDGDVCYHKKCDIVDDRLDFNYASLIAKAVGIMVADILK
ncbi:MAG: M28 family peptidase [Bdellovibrionota bacterium]